MQHPLAALGGRNVLDNGVEQREDAVGRFLPVVRHPALLRRAVHRGKIQLLFGGVEVEHQVEHLLVHLVGAAVGFVHLVDHHDGSESQGQGFAQHKAGLRHGAFKGIHQQNDPVGHLEHPLYLAAKVRVTRRVDDVDLDVFVAHRHVFRDDGNAAFALQVVAVEQQFAHLLVVAEDFGSVNDFIHQRGFAVVYVGNDGHISDILHRKLSSLSMKAQKYEIRFGFCSGNPVIIASSILSQAAQPYPSYPRRRWPYPSYPRRRGPYPRGAAPGCAAGAY